MDSIPRPKFKIGDIVIAKLWTNYNQVEILGAFYCNYRKKWFYTLKDKNSFVRHCKPEEKILFTNT